MIHCILIAVIGLLLLLLLLGLRQYKARYGYSFWYDFSLSENSSARVSLIHTPLDKLYLGTTDKKILLDLHKQGCRKFLAFRVGAFENACIIIATHPQQRLWVTVFVSDSGSYCALTAAYLKNDEKHAITLSNAPIYESQQVQHLRINYKSVGIKTLFERLDKQLPVKRRHKMSLPRYMRLSKVLFWDELVAIHRSNVEQKQLEIPLSFAQPHQKLINKFAKAHHISTHFLNKNSHKILLVNDEVSPDYLVANIVTASKDLYNKRKMILASLIATKDSRQWFKNMNEKISESNKFHYLGTISDGDLRTDFYYHQSVTLRFRQGNVHRV